MRNGIKLGGENCMVCIGLKEDKKEPWKKWYDEDILRSNSQILN